jgi:hypothetical protein
VPVPFPLPVHALRRQTPGFAKVKEELWQSDVEGYYEVKFGAPEDRINVQRAVVVFVKNFDIKNFVM